MNLRHWLRKQPQAFSVVCNTANGEKKLAINRKSAKCWAEAEASIVGLCAHHVEALDAKGNVLRVCDLDVEMPGDEEEPEREKVKLSRFGRDLTQMSNLLAGAFRDGATSQKEAYTTSFEYMRQLCDVVMKRLEGLEKAWIRNLNLHTKFNTEQDAEEHPLAPLIAAVVQQQMAGAVAPNGKAPAGDA